MDVTRLRALDLFVTFAPHPKVEQYYERPVHFFTSYMKCLLYGINWHEGNELIIIKC